VSARAAARGSFGAAVVLAIVLGAAPWGSRGAAAGETQWWISDSPEDYAKSEAHGLVVQSDGSLELGPTAQFSAAESLGVVWAIAVMKDGSVAVAGDAGSVLRFREGVGFSVLARLPVGQILSLASDGDGVVAGTAPGGLIYRIGARGDTALVARTGERYVWGLVPAAGGGWYAATGTRGRLLRVNGRNARVVLDTEESNLVSLIAGPRGAVYTGGDSKGRIYRVAGDHELRTVYDASEDEVRALAFGPDAALYAVALSASAVSEEEGDATQRPAPVKSAVSGGRAIVYRIVPDSTAAAIWTSPQPFVFALAGLRGGVVAATGNRAALYRLTADSGASQWLQGPQGQVTALAVDGKGRLYAATSNPAGLWRVGPENASRGEVISPVHDARRFASFGAVRWRGEARGSSVRLSTRSGNTDPPDSTWSAWSRGGTDELPRSRSPVARYFQWRLAAEGGTPHVESVEAAWREQNLPPKVEELTVAPQGQGFREGEMTPRAEAVTQTLPGGQKVEYSAPLAASPKSVRDLPMFARGLRTLQWRGSDPNGDALRFTVQVRNENGGAWIKVDDDLEGSTFTWDTNGLPDGRYRVRVIASDAIANPMDEALTGEALSAPFSVDNTAPVVTELSTQPQRGAVVVTGRAEDASSTLTRVQVSLDNGDWRTITPEGGFADERTLSFRTRMPDVEPGEHTLSVRATDTAGNTATRASRVTVPRSR
jgi:Big-like domain-containing protein